MAELELGGGDTLILHGRSFTKNELIDYFEDLQREDIAAYHLVISEDPVLLGFLQYAWIDAGARFRHAGIYHDPNFIRWVSPYFRTAFTQLAKVCLRQTDATGMRTILDNKLIMTADDMEWSWLFIERVLEKNIALFDRYRGRGQRTSPAMMPIARISDFIGHAYIEVIRQLPDSRFARIKDSYAFNMQHPAIAVFNRDLRNRSLSMIWIEDALNLAVSEGMKKRIQAKLNELNGLLKKQEKKRTRRIVFIIIIGVCFVFGLLDNFDDSSSPNSTRDSLVYPQPVPTTVIQDSVVVTAKRKDTAHHRQARSSSP
ncbi:MAG TPA: hypothetical protein VHD83_20345 [Puia sp.]|nr:hypothetical protein [Puia sp.]